MVKEDMLRQESVVGGVFVLVLRIDTLAINTNMFYFKGTYSQY